MSNLLIFGAGASKDAGLPDAFELTTLAVESIQRSDTRASEVLNFVSGALLFHASIKGANPLATRIDAESLYRALEVLERRDDAELAAFVGAYHPRVGHLAGPGADASDAFGHARRLLLNAVAAILMRPPRDIS